MTSLEKDHDSIKIVLNKFERVLRHYKKSWEDSYSINQSQTRSSEFSKGLVEFQRILHTSGRVYEPSCVLRKS